MFRPKDLLLYLVAAFALFFVLDSFFQSESHEALSFKGNGADSRVYSFKSSNPSIPPTVFRFDANPRGRALKFSELLNHLNYSWKNENTYVEDIYDCKHFAYQLYLDALNDGFAVRFVALKFKGLEVGHALNAFMTTDKGIVYVDFTAVRSEDGGYTSPSKSIAWAKVGYEYLTLPTYDLRDDFSNLESDFSKRAHLEDSYKSKVQSFNERVQRFNAEYEDFANNFRNIASRNPAEAKALQESFEQRREAFKKEEDAFWFESKNVNREGRVSQTGKIVQEMRFLPTIF